MIHDFPDPNNAPKNAPIAFGGNLDTKTLIGAYKKGIFPWFMNSEPILWWSPDPRAVIYPKNIRVQKSMKQFLCNYHVKFDNDFEGLINLCKEHRQKLEPTWISTDIIKAYSQLHEDGYAHSVEVYENNVLIGGLYGLSFGKIFCGESMVSVKKNASKVALIMLCKVLEKYDFLIDAQVMNKHLEFMGAVNLSRNVFLKQLDTKINEYCGFNSFKELDLGINFA